VIRIALQMLTGDRPKYLTLISGLSFVSFLFVQQGSVFCGLMLRTTVPVEVVGAPIWVADPTLQSIDESKPLLDTDLTRVRSVPGVKWAVPLYLRQTQARLSDGRLGPARLYGLDTATLLGRPARMIEGDSAELHTPDSVIVGKAQSERLGSPKVGDVFEINDRLARVVGIADAPRDFQGNPFIFTTYDRALQYTPLQRKQLNFILAAPQDSLTVEQVIANIRAATGLAAYSEDGLRWLTINYYIANTGIPITIGLSLMQVFIIGMAIAGQTFYSFALENQRYFGALKAMGAGGLTLTVMLIVQSLLVGLIGYGIGAGAASLVGWFVGCSKVAMFTPYQLLLISGAVTMGICLLASLFSVWRVLRLEPAVVFRA
jgi:putative ABC transport system permease protein